MFTLLTTETADPAVSLQTTVSNLVASASSMSNEELISWGLSATLSVGSKILLALAIYLVGAWIIKWVVNLLKKLFEAKSVEVSLSQFLVSLVKIVLMIILIFTIVGVLGINTSSFLALFASAGLAVGMALSGTLQNFAGGVLILFLKPFKVGDFIEAQGFSGTVKEISLFSTLLNTPDNKMIIIPNGSLSNNTINNYSKEEIRRVDWTVGVSYGSDIAVVTGVINELLESNEFVLQNEPKVVELSVLNSSSVDIVVRAWCKSSDYWSLYWGMNRKVYDTFNEKGIEFPFPQMDVTLKNK